MFFITKMLIYVLFREGKIVRSYPSFKEAYDGAVIIQDPFNLVYWITARTSGEGGINSCPSPSPPMELINALLKRPGDSVQFVWDGVNYTIELTIFEGHVLCENVVFAWIDIDELIRANT